MASGKPVKVAFLADTSDLKRSLAQAEDAMNSAAAEAKSAGDRIDTAFDSTANSADTVASKGSQAAGALTGLGELAGGPFGAAMAGAGIAIQGAADAGDLLNVVTDTSIGKLIAQKAALIATTVATNAAKVATLAFNLAMRLNPIGLVITAILALIIVIPQIAKHWDVVTAAMKDAWNFIKNTFIKVFDALKSAATTSFTGIKNVVGDMIGAVKSLLSTAFSFWREPLQTAFGNIIDFIRGVPGRIEALGGKFREAGSGLMNMIVEGIKSAAGFIGDVASSIWNAVKGMVNQAIDRINAGLEFTINIPGPGPDIHINAPNIPHLASGGIVRRPTLALIGEAGPEAVVPLNGKYGMGGTYVQVNVSVPPTANQAEIGREIRRALDAWANVNGGAA
jgi:hypothetical protein